MTHEALRHFADSWGLLLLVAIFVTAVAWTFRPGARAHHEAARMIPFRDGEAEAPGPGGRGDER
ncbi:MAG: cbb3-type cytochrome c oxidase subunit 3 [Thermaurantiacus tibetensis]|uniref:cbb3-type cytochrome c oxidase subunit 3 n=1 Tax=Thermaurantiacus tibetensis TaxID=2759035 RepID=UPI00188DFBA9|nr:cbb3-type cytochrome c oxidase subunit 3 [Thermaurantiacus tibetensis]